MPFATNNGVRLYWRLDGAEGRPPLVLLNSIGTDLSSWDRALPHLLRDFRTLRIDARGHGASDAPAGDYRMADLAEDVTAVMADAGVSRAPVAGVSLGGMVAMEFALAFPERVSALALICTSAEMDRTAWEERIAKVRGGGTEAIADLALGRFLSPAFAQANPPIADTIKSGLIAMADDGYAGAGAAIRDMALIDRIASIDVPVLVAAGRRDVSTPVSEHGARIAERIPGATLTMLDCAHLAQVDAPAEVAAALRAFLLPDPPHEAAEAALFEAGLVNRRRILGDEWVERSLAARTEFNTDFQAMITRVAWHEVWGRPGLDDRTRRLLVIAITAALGRWEEFRLHARAGLEQGGFTAAELKEVLMQTGIYAGLPAANTAFTEAGEIIAELQGDQK